MPNSNRDGRGSGRLWRIWPASALAAHRARRPHGSGEPPVPEGDQALEDALGPYRIRFLAPDGRWHRPARPNSSSQITLVDEDGNVGPFTHPAIDDLVTPRTQTGVTRLLNQGWTPEAIRTLLTPK